MREKNSIEREEEKINAEKEAMACSCSSSVPSSAADGGCAWSICTTAGSLAPEEALARPVVMPEVDEELVHADGAPAVGIASETAQGA